MYEKLFRKPSTISRHRNAPYAAERARYLTYCSDQGYTQATLLLKAYELLWVARKLSAFPDLHLSCEEVRKVGCRWKNRERSCGRSLNKQWTQIRFFQTAVVWLRFLGCLRKPTEPIRFAPILDEFCNWMEHERGLALTTIERRRGHVRHFLRWYGKRHRPFSQIRLNDIDAFLAECKSRGYQRVSLVNVADAIRAFLRHAGCRNSCNTEVWRGIRGPRLFPQETLPLGPTWSEVTAVIEGMRTDVPIDIRDRAIILLFAFYGLRASEVSGLRLENIDWEHDRLHLRRAKGRGIQTYPLLSVLGNALALYLKECRPRSDYREVFLTRNPPFRPLSRSALYGVVRKRLDALGIRTLHLGPHSLRHACARHLVTEGFSLKEIGDYLGHRSSSATRIYAKVDLPALREVAAFDLGGLI